MKVDYKHTYRFCMKLHVFISNYILVPRVKVTTLGFSSRADSELKSHIRGLLEKYPTFGREKETGLLGALDT